MKNFYSFLFFAVSLAVFSQTPATDQSNFIQTEAEHYKTLIDYNVNPNTLNYDLKYQRIELQLDPAVTYISGKVTSHFVANENISAIYFDLTNGLSVSQVLHHGNPLDFEQLSSKEIKIFFEEAVSSNTLDSLSIEYSGVPNTASDGIYFREHSSGLAAFSLTEPYGSREWFPTKQSLNDKIERVDLKITTPLNYSTAGNGILISETVNGIHKTAFWRTEYPIPAYLVAIGVSNYIKTNETMGNPPFQFVNYLFPQTAANTYVQENLEWTKSLMDMFEQHFGSYPYRNEKYGHMEFTFNGSGMEHATMSSMGGFSKDLIAHELAHQWFGDKITCGAWNDIWLNEGFATFGQHLNNEKMVMNSDEFMNYLSNQKNYITSVPNGSVYVPDANLGDVYRIFNGRLSYAKGGYVLRMIKWILGDEVFYQALKDYASRPQIAYGYAVTSDFENSLEQSTGKDFSEFMNDWIYGQGYPSYTIKWKQTGTSLAILAAQTQSDPSVDFFELPLPIKVNGTSGEIAYLVLNHTHNNQFFTNEIGFPVSSVDFNNENQIIERNSTVLYDSQLNLAESAKQKIHLYPNPVKDILKISGIHQNFEYSIFSMNGDKIISGTSNGTVPVSDLGKGVYVIVIENQTFKFIKE